MASTPRIRRRTAALSLLAVLTLLTTAACSSGAAGSTSSSTAASASGYRGDALPQPVTLTSADLTAPFRTSAGGTTTLAQLQRGHLMLVYFGYTHCPDVCPTTMADLGNALRDVPTVIQARTRVVFVTSDPARDTAPVMKSWLSNFDPNLAQPFVGLTASLTQIDAVAKSVGVPLSPPVKQPNGTISVEHGAQTLAFINGKAHVLWTANTSATDYAHDITKLAAQVTVAPVAAAHS